MISRRGRQAREEREELGRQDMHHEREGERAIIIPKEMD